MNKKQYQEYLQSSHWQDTKHGKLYDSGWRCEKCGDGSEGVQLDVHHLTYERIGHERDSDLQVLCRACHSSAHSTKFFPADTISNKEIDDNAMAFLLLAVDSKK